MALVTWLVERARHRYTGPGGALMQNINEDQIHPRLRLDFKPMLYDIKEDPGSCSDNRIII